MRPAHPAALALSEVPAMLEAVLLSALVLIVLAAGSVAR